MVQTPINFRYKHISKDDLKKSLGKTNSCYKLLLQGEPNILVYLAVGIDYRSQQFPGTPSSVHAHHPQDL